MAAWPVDRGDRPVESWAPRGPAGVGGLTAAPLGVGGLAESQPGPHQGSYEPLRRPDRKDLDKPETYNGSVDHWHDLLEQVEALRGKPVTAAHEAQLAAQLGLGRILQRKDGLNEYLEVFTKGASPGHRERLR